MLALPSGPGVFGTILLALGLALGAGLGFVAWRRLRALLGSAGAPGSSAAVVLAVALASSAGAAPFVAWRIVQDLRYTTGISRENAERIGAFENSLDGGVFDRVAAEMPATATYYVADSGGPASGDFRAWAQTVLLPRIAVSDPRRADWLLTFNRDPSTVGVAVTAVRRVPTSYGKHQIVYLARIAH